MSHPDPLFDPENAYEDDMNYDDYNDFHDGVDGDDRTNEYWPNLTTGGDYEDEAEVELETREDEEWYASHDDGDDSMDGDFDSAMRDAGWGTDEDYGYYGEDY